jgi:hypothetical protein
MADNSALLTYVQDQLNSLLSDAQSAVSGLQAAASSYITHIMSTHFASIPDWTEDAVTAINASAKTELPATRPTLALPVFSLDPSSYLPANMTETYRYDSDFFDTFLDADLRAFIADESKFITTTVQEAMFGLTRDRDLQTLSDALDATTRVQSARRGFPIPISMLNAAQNDLAKKHQDISADRNREITALVAERAHDGRKHAIDAGLRMEDIRSRVQLAFHDLYWKASDMLIRKYETEVRAKLAELQNEWEQVQELNKIKAQNADLSSDQLKRVAAKQLQRLATMVSDWNASVQAWQTSLHERVNAAAAEVTYYQNAVVGASGMITGLDLNDKTGTA